MENPICDFFIIKNGSIPLILIIMCRDLPIMINMSKVTYMLLMRYLTRSYTFLTYNFYLGFVGEYSIYFALVSDTISLT